MMLNLKQQVDIVKLIPYNLNNDNLNYTIESVFHYVENLSLEGYLSSDFIKSVGFRRGRIILNDSFLVAIDSDGDIFFEGEGGLFLESIHVRSSHWVVSTGPDPENRYFKEDIIALGISIPKNVTDWTDNDVLLLSMSL